jgi:hypothetical protein
MFAIMLALSFAACSDDENEGGGNSQGNNSASGNGGSSSSTSGAGNTFGTVAAFKTWFASQIPNTAAEPYTVKLNISSLGGGADDNGSVGYVIKDDGTKYVILDLSGSTLNGIGNYAFDYCGDKLVGVILPSTVSSIGEYAFFSCGMTSITIPAAVNLIEDRAFADCTALVSVTFEGSVTTLTGNPGGTSTTSIGNLFTVYVSEGRAAGTYTRDSGSLNWEKTL